MTTALGCQESGGRWIRRSNQSNLPAIEGGVPVRPPGRFLVFGAPAIGEEEIAAVVATLRSRWIGTGPRVEQFERNFAAYKGAQYAIAVGSCTAALHLSLLTLNLASADEVIAPSMTFCSTVNAVLHAGAKPVLADCDLWTMNLTAASIARQLTPRSRAIIVVHMCGRACPMGQILELAGEAGLSVIEDCAHAIEATVDGVAAGLLGDLGCFSFYATKNLTTAEGGMILTKNEDVANRLRRLALHGLSADAYRRFSDSGYRHYVMEEPGFKYNITDLQAAIGLEQLNKIETHWRRREQIWQQYMSSFQDLPCFLPPSPSQGTRHSYHLFTPLLDLDQLRVSRDQILAALTAENIGVGVHYLPVHSHPYYREVWGWQRGSFPNSEFIGDRTLSLPLAADLDDEAVADVIIAFRRVLKYYRR
ncbi:MAG: DegT/DnrJ/EryC1/StrS family aminotransferase [Alphaproteobacteria bacterium]|nr:DegT/DnrJ/EryC1/StrS family aminotransferase [Alphaproteobacteria bacterium]